MLKEYFEIPTHCPICKTELAKTDVKLFCPNNNCEAREFRRLEKYIAKLDVKGFGPALLTYLYDSGFVKKISDFYKVDLEEVLASTNLKKATMKAFSNLLAVKELPLETFISGFDIEGVGERIIEFAVNEGFDTLEKLRDENLENVNGLGPDRAKWINEGVAKQWDDMQETLKFVKIKGVKEEKMDNVLVGKAFAFTGKLNEMTRDEAFALVISNGGKVSKSITKNTNYLVTNDTDTGTKKNLRAEELGVKIITEVEFLEMLE